MKRISLNQIAEAAGVSKMTASRAMRNAPGLSEKNRKRIQKIAHEMGYVADPRIREVMESFRRSEKPSYQETLGFIVTHPSWSAEREIGLCRKSAAEFGYKMDVFKAFEYGEDRKHLLHVLQTRNIRGLIVAPNSSEISPVFDFPFEDFTTVLLGSSLHNQGLPRVQIDHFQMMRLTLEKLAESGLHKSAMILDRSFDERTNRSLSSAYLGFEHPEKMTDLRDRIFFYERKVPATVFKWLEKLNPEVIILDSGGLYLEISRKIKTKNRGMKTVCLSKGASTDKCFAVIEQSTEEICNSAIRIVISWMKNGLVGYQNTPTVTMIPGKWKPERLGAT